MGQCSTFMACMPDTNFPPPRTSDDEEYEALTHSVNPPLIPSRHGVYLHLRGREGRKLAIICTKRPVSVSGHACVGAYQTKQTTSIKCQTHSFMEPSNSVQADCIKTGQPVGVGCRNARRPIPWKPAAIPVHGALVAVAQQLCNEVASVQPTGTAR
jgi:hypothetical protein